MARITIILFLTSLTVVCGGLPCSATQLDYTGSDRITSQVWKLDITIDPMGQDSFCIRFPYPDYTWVGRWDRYSTENIDIGVTCDEPGPFSYEFHHYNQGYSNQGVWIKVFYPPDSIGFHYQIKQSATLNLPGHNYPLLHFTNNGWMCGSAIVDVGDPIVQQVLDQAQQLAGTWHSRGYWKECEKTVNWMHGHITFRESDMYALRSASQVLKDTVGGCVDWAHAACAVLLKAGIPAKTVLVGALTGHNATNCRFQVAGTHVCLAYWDGFGWILIDPFCTSGFTFISRVILGADRDVSTIRIKTDPEYLILSVQGGASCVDGSQSGFLNLWGDRCPLYSWEILEHYELPDAQNPQGTEPLNNIIPNVPTSVESSPPSGDWLLVNYPNPFNPSTTFSFRLQRQGRVRIDVFSVNGALVANVVDAFMTEGEKRIVWKADSVASGVYFVRYQAPDIVGTRKIIILR